MDDYDVDALGAVSSSSRLSLSSSCSILEFSHRKFYQFRQHVELGAVFARASWGLQPQGPNGLRSPHTQSRDRHGTSSSSTLSLPLLHIASPLQMTKFIVWCMTRELT